MYIKNQLDKKLKLSIEEIEKNLESVTLIKRSISDANGTIYELNAAIIQEQITLVALDLKGKYNDAMHYLESELIGLVKYKKQGSSKQRIMKFMESKENIIISYTGEQGLFFNDKDKELIDEMDPMDCVYIYNELILSIKECNAKGIDFETCPFYILRNRYGSNGCYDCSYAKNHGGSYCSTLKERPSVKCNRSLKDNECVRCDSFYCSSDTHKIKKETKGDHNVFLSNDKYLQIIEETFV